MPTVVRGHNNKLISHDNLSTVADLLLTPASLMSSIYYQPLHKYTNNAQ